MGKAEADKEEARKAKEKAEKEAKEKAEREQAETLAKRLIDEPTCPGYIEHFLISFVSQAGFPCDVCGKESIDGATIWGCRNMDKHGRRTCDYDCCQECADKQVQNKQKSAGR